MRENAKIETVMTYEDWEREYFSRSQKAKEEVQYFIIQKLIGCILIILSLLAMYALNDGTICVITVPLGLYLVFTKEKVIYDFHQN